MKKFFNGYLLPLIVITALIGVSLELCFQQPELTIKEIGLGEVKEISGITKIFPTFTGEPHVGEERPLSHVESVVVHSTGNVKDYATAEFHVTYLDTTTREVSWHFTVDDKHIIQHLPLTTIGWHAGKECNATTVGIEICQYECMDEERALKNLDYLLAILKWRLPEGVDIKTHEECTGKECPSLPSLREYLQKREE